MKKNINVLVLTASLIAILVATEQSESRQEIVGFKTKPEAAELVLGQRLSQRSTTEQKTNDSEKQTDSVTRDPDRVYQELFLRSIIKGKRKKDRFTA